MQIVNRANPVTYRWTWKLEDGWIRRCDDLHAKALKWCAEIASIAHSKVRYNGPVATKSTTDADRLLVRQLIEFVHRGVA